MVVLGMKRARPANDESNAPTPPVPAGLAALSNDSAEAKRPLKEARAESSIASSTAHAPVASASTDAGSISSIASAAASLLSASWPQNVGALQEHLFPLLSQSAQSSARWCEIKCIPGNGREAATYKVNFEDGSTRLIASTELVDLVRNQVIRDHTRATQASLFSQSLPALALPNLRADENLGTAKTGEVKNDPETFSHDSDDDNNEDEDDDDNKERHQADKGCSDVKKTSVSQAKDAEMVDQESKQDAKHENQEQPKSDVEGARLEKASSVQENEERGKVSSAPASASSSPVYSAQPEESQEDASNASVSDRGSSGAGAVLATVSSSLLEDRATTSPEQSESLTASTANLSSSQGGLLAQGPASSQGGSPSQVRPGAIRSNSRLGTKSSTYHGVSWHTQRKRWRAYIYLSPGKQKYLGTFTDQHEAAKTYDNAVLKHNLRSPLNFPNQANAYHHAHQQLDGATRLSQSHRSSSISSSSSLSASPSMTPGSLTGSARARAMARAAAAAGDRALELDRQRIQNFQQPSTASQHDASTFVNPQNMLHQQAISFYLQQQQQQQQYAPSVISRLENALTTHLQGSSSSESSSSSMYQQQFLQLQAQLNLQQQHQHQQQHQQSSPARSPAFPFGLPASQNSNIATLSHLLASGAVVPSSTERAQMQQLVQTTDAYQTNFNQQVRNELFRRLQEQQQQQQQQQQPSP